MDRKYHDPARTGKVDSFYTFVARARLHQATDPITRVSTPRPGPASGDR